MLSCSLTTVATFEERLSLLRNIWWRSAIYLGLAPPYSSSQAPDLQNQMSLPSYFGEFSQ